eukprot:scaffold260208_cov28-Tisochrysis_lutea.AAC.2
MPSFIACGSARQGHAHQSERPRRPRPFPEQGRNAIDIRGWLKAWAVRHERRAAPQASHSGKSRRVHRSEGGEHTPAPPCDSMLAVDPVPRPTTIFERTWLSIDRYPTSRFRASCGDSSAAGAPLGAGAAAGAVAGAPKAASALERISLIGTAGSEPLKVAEPATITLAPAAAATSTLAAESPPSTWMSRLGHWLRSAATLAIMSGMNDWPPKPGSTVITSAMSISERYGEMASTGVPGFTAMPTFIPA